METQLIPIGNSKGIRIPAALIKQCGLEGTLNLHVRDNMLIISSAARKPRETWEQSILAAGPADMLIDDALDLDDPNWTW